VQTAAVPWLLIILSFAEWSSLPVACIGKRGWKATDLTLSLCPFNVEEHSDVISQTFAVKSSLPVASSGSLQ
jgi:hypothetical protein